MLQNGIYHLTWLILVFAFGPVAVIFCLVPFDILIHSNAFLLVVIFTFFVGCFGTLSIVLGRASNLGNLVTLVSVTCPAFLFWNICTFLTILCMAICVGNFIAMFNLWFGNEKLHTLYTDTINLRFCLSVEEFRIYILLQVIALFLQ